MSLSGRGAIAIWNDIRPDTRADFFEWHNREHMPERVAIPGFRRGRRFGAVDAQPEFFTLYETDGPEVLTGADYLARLDNPTPWTRRVVVAFLNTSRSLCRVAMSLGPGEGGLIVTFRCEVAEELEEEMLRVLTEDALPRLADRTGIVGAHLCLADRAASNVQTAEKKVRSEISRVPSWIIFVEGGSDAEALKSACDDALSSEALSAAGAIAPIERGLYQLQYCRSPQDSRLAVQEAPKRNPA
jgi:hypothetical protein